MSNVIRFPPPRPKSTRVDLSSPFRVEIWRDGPCFMFTVFDCGDPVFSTAYVTYEDALAAASRYDLAEVVDKIGGGAA